MIKKVSVSLCIVMVLVFFTGCATGDKETTNKEKINFAEAGFSVIRPEKDEFATELATSVFKAVKENTEVKLVNALDSEPENTLGEIIIGDTIRPESKEAKELIAEKGGFGYANEYIICFLNGKIVINALSPTALKVAVDRFIADYCKKCTVPVDLLIVFADNSNFKNLSVNGVSLGNYKIVIPRYNCSYLVTTEVELLTKNIEEYIGCLLPIVDDSSEVTEYEIIIDKCSRDSVNSSLSSDEFEIKQEGNKIYICGGRNYSTAYAVEKFAYTLKNTQGNITANLQGEYNGKSNNGGYSLVWYDEFDTLNKATWVQKNGPGSESYGGWYGMKTYRSTKPENVCTKDGKLYLTATYDDKYFYGSYMSTAGSVEFAKGYMEISARVADGNGIWHDFWTWRSGSNHLEIDIMECWSGGYYYVNYLHEFTPSGGDKAVANAAVTKDGIANGWRSFSDDYKKDYNNSMNKEFHTFGCEWTDTNIIFTRDGEVTLDYEFAGTDTADLYEKTHYFVLSMLVGSNYKNLTPEQDDGQQSVINRPILGADYWNDDRASFIIEYIQLYQKPGQYLRLS